MTILASRISIAAALLLTAIVVAAVGFISVHNSPPQRASAATDGAEMSLSINDQTGSVNMPAGSTFEVVVNAEVIPKTNGYVIAQAYIAFGNDLTFKSSETVWPDCNFKELADSFPGGAYRGCLTEFIPLESFYLGSLFVFELTCSAQQTSSEIELVPYQVEPAGGDGSVYVELLTGERLAPPATTITVNCIPAQSEPGDTDGDGCSDQKELGGDETLGGRRNFVNPWDFYDVLGGGGGPPDRIVDLPNDILGVIQHFSPSGAAPYDVQFDRGPSTGPNPWNMTAPDGVIDLPNDVLGVIQQFGHSCR